MDGYNPEMRWRFPLLGAALVLGGVLYFAALRSGTPLTTDWGTPSDREAAVDTVRAALAGRPASPSAIAALEGARPRRVFVTLYTKGKGRRGESSGALAPALTAAAREAAGDDPAAQWIKVDVVTAETDLPATLDAARMESYFEPGVDGIRSEISGSTGGPAGVVLPSDPIAEGWFSPRRNRSGASAAQSTYFTRGDEGMDALKRADIALQQALAPAPGGKKPEAIRHIRFRTASFLAPAPAGSPHVLLYRGMPERPRSPSPEQIRQSALAGGKWLVAQLGQDGKFTYTYLPNKDSVPGNAGYSSIRHAACAWMLVKIGRRFAVPEWVDAGARAVRWIEPFIVPIAGPENRWIVDAPGEVRGGLGHNAMAVIAMLEMRDMLQPDELERVKGLGRSLEKMLRQDGGFFENEAEALARPPGKRDTLLYEPGEAFLALVLLAEAFPEEAHWRDSALASAEYQAGKFMNAGDGLFTLHAVARLRFVDRVHWQTQALDRLAILTGDRRWDEAAVAMGDAILASGTPPVTVALTIDERPVAAAPADYYGGFPLPGRVPRATPTGSRAEALNAARRCALRLGRDTRPIETALIRIAGFQLRNQFDDAACYWCPAPEKAAGAFRAGLTDNEVRIDYIQHIVAGMADTLEWYDAPAGGDARVEEATASTPGR